VARGPAVVFDAGDCSRGRPTLPVSRGDDARVADGMLRRLENAL